MLKKAVNEYRRKIKEAEISQRLRQLKEKRKKVKTQEFLMGDSDE